MPKLSDDRRGLEGLPLKLLITSLVISLSAPALYSSVAYLDFASRLDRAMDVASEIKRAAVSAYVGGPGNVRIVSLKLDPIAEGSAAIRLGGEENEAQARVIEVLWEGELAATLTLEEPSFSIVTGQGSALLLEGLEDIRLSCEEGTEGPVVLVEVA